MISQSGYRHLYSQDTEQFHQHKNPLILKREGEGEGNIDLLFHLFMHLLVTAFMWCIGMIF